MQHNSLLLNHYLRRSAIAASDTNVRRLLIKAMFRTSPHYAAILAAPLARKDYPPAQFKGLIDKLNELGLSSHADEVQNWWNTFWEKYFAAVDPNDAKKLSFGAVYAHGMNSLKKNVFKYKYQTIAEYLAAVVDEAKAGKGSDKPTRPLAKKDMDLAQALDNMLPKDMPAIAIPKPKETIEDWAAATEETKKKIAALEGAFDDVHQFIKAMQKEIKEIEQKIAKYSPGGEKATNKGGGASKYAERIPKWTQELAQYKEKLKEVEHKVNTAEKTVDVAKEAYKTVPVTTVAFEKAAQEELDNLLEYIMNMTDLKKQAQMLKKFNAMVAKNKTTASVEVVAGPLDQLAAFLKGAWQKLAAWGKGLVGAANGFHKLCTMHF